jgi:hypothetical protein
MNLKSFLVGISTVLFLTIGNLKAQLKPKEGVVKNYMGRPTIHVNGEPLAPIFYALTHAYTGRWSWEENPQRQLNNFCQIGVKLFQLDLYFEDIWYKGAKELDIVKAQKQVQGLLDVCPDANVVLRIHVNAPFWWNDEHPEELSAFADGPLDTRAYGAPYNNEDGDTERPRRASLASLKYREAATEKLIEFCKKMPNTVQGNSVIGIHVCWGVFGEWHYWGYPQHEGDVGLAMTGYFRNWLKNKYKTSEALQKAWNTNKFTLENATVPDTTERMYTTNGIFRDPVKEKRVIDYFTCQHEVVADDIEHFCKVVKQNWNRPIIVGVFYGYFHMTFSRQAVGGHLFIERILNSPYIDYLSAPQSYFWMAKESGGPGHSRGVIESAMLHNKLFLDEVDNGYLQNTNELDPVRSIYSADPKYVPMIRRSALMPLSRGMGFWYYDFGFRRTAGWWDHPVYLKNIKEEYTYFENRKNTPFQSGADVLYVWDMESFYYLFNKWTPVIDDMVDKAAAESYKTGAAIDHVYLFDLPKVNLNQYKAVVFMNIFKVSQAQKDFIAKNVAANGRTLIYNYMPGIIEGENYNDKRVSEFTGMTLTAINYKDKPKVKTISTDYPSVSYDFMKFVNPLFCITDKQATPIAKIDGTDYIVLSKKDFKNYKVVYGSLTIHEPILMQKILKDAGVHIYNEVTTETTMAKDNLIWIYTLEGGKREVKLKNGKTIKIELAPQSTTLFDGITGEKVF